MNIGENIRTLRLSKNLTQQAIAKKIGISVTAFGDIERGKTKDFTVTRLSQIAFALDVSAKELVDDRNSAHSSSDTDLIRLQGQIIENYKLALVQKVKEAEYYQKLFNKANRELKKQKNKLS